MTAPSNIKDFRAAIRWQLQIAGFSPVRIAPKMPLAWTLPGEEIEPVFFPHEMRRPWGFRLSGILAIELPSLRQWLLRKDGPIGVFHHSFVNYHLANDDMLGGFDAINAASAPLDEWIGLITERVCVLPKTVDELIHTYRTSPDHLGLFADPINKPAWDFLMRWRDDPSADLQVLQTLFGP